MKINLEDVKKFIEYRKTLNNVELDEIEFYKNTERIYIDEEFLKNSKYSGLSNFYMIESYFQKELN